MEINLYYRYSFFVKTLKWRVVSNAQTELEAVCNAGFQKYQQTVSIRVEVELTFIKRYKM